jgi:HlyD family secretion protein
LGNNNCFANPARFRDIQLLLMQVNQRSLPIGKMSRQLFTVQPDVKTLKRGLRDRNIRPAQALPALTVTPGGERNAQYWKDRSVRQDRCRAGDDRIRVQDRQHGPDLASLDPGWRDPARDGVLLAVPALHFAGMEHGGNQAHFLSTVSGPTMAEQIISLPQRGPLSTSVVWAGLLAHKWFVLSVAVILGLGAWQAARVILGPTVVVDQVKRGNLIETVVASGHVETPYRVEIGSQITGTVEEVLVEEGERVTKGRPLISLEARELRASVVQARGAVAQAEARVRQLDELTLPSAREALTQAEATLLNAQQTFDRTDKLAKDGFATRAALDDAQKTLDVARAVKRAAEFQVYTASPGGSDYVMAQTQLNQARANLDTAESRLGYATISAPRDGVLITRNVERGTVVQPGKALLVLAPTGDVQLVLQIDERNLGKITLGQKAIASADAYPDLRFPAVITYINPGIDITRASVEVKLVVSDPPEYVRQDMTVSVDIEVASRVDTLVLPTRSVHDALSGQPWVLGIKNRRASKQSVKLGLRGNTEVEILEGLSAYDVAIPSNSGVVTGQRIRAVVP